MKLQTTLMTTLLLTSLAMAMAPTAEARPILPPPPGGGGAGCDDSAIEKLYCDAMDIASGLYDVTYRTVGNMTNELHKYKDEVVNCVTNPPSCGIRI